MRKIVLGLAGAAMVAMLAACGGGSSNQGVTDHLSGGVGGVSACSTCAPLSATGGVAGNGSLNVSDAASIAAPENVPINSGLAVSNTTEVFAVGSTAATLSSATGFGTPITSLPQTSGTNSTVTIVTDQSGNLASMAFNITNNPAAPYVINFTPGFQTAVAGSAGPPVVNPVPGIYVTAVGQPTLTPWGGSSPTYNLSFTTGDMAPVFKSVNDNGGTSYFMVSQLAGTLGAPSVLSTGAYGMWMNNINGGSGAMGTFAIGKAPLLASIPVSGMATYNGRTIGAATTSTGGNLMVLTGVITLTANFGTGSMLTSITGITTQNVENNTIGAISDLGGTQTISSATYQGALTGAGGYVGTLKGGFSGASAAETTGTWSVSNGSVTAIGAYGAKQ